MRCINCRKEILDQDIYCVHCGEKLYDNYSVNDTYNYNVDNQKVYDEVGSKVTEYGTNVKENAPVYYERFKTFIAKNKVAAIIGSVAILAVIFGICMFNYIQGRPVNESKLQNYLVGQTIMVEDNSYEIKEEQIKSLTNISRKSENKKSDVIQGSLILDLDNAVVTADVNYELMYDKNNNKWVFKKLSNSKVKSIEPKVALNDSIKDLLKEVTVDYNYYSIDLKEGLLKDIQNINISGTGISNNGTAELVLSNGVVEAIVSTDFEARFDLREGKWVLNSTYLPSKIVQKEQIADNLSDEDKKKFILSAFEDDRGYLYKYKVGNFDYAENIILTKDNMSDLKVNNFMEYEDSIRAEIEGQAACGDISKIKFSGVVTLDLSLSKNSRANREVNIDSVELSNINIDSIKKDMLKYKIDGKQITVAIADTFTIGSENADSRMFYKVYEGTITVNGVVEKLKSRIEIDYNDKNKKYEWKLDSMDIIKK